MHSTSSQLNLPSADSVCGVGAISSLADRHQILGPADHAAGGAADLDMRNRPDRLQLEHEVEGRHLQHADIGHAQQVGDIFNRRAGKPPFLFLRAPQQRDDRAGLTTFGIFGNLPPGPGKVRRREFERGGLLFVKTAKQEISPAQHYSSGGTDHGPHEKTIAPARPEYGSSPRGGPQDQRPKVDRQAGHHRSISPNTTSIVPMMADTSASW
jgi:hypothetical protein